MCGAIINDRLLMMWVRYVLRYRRNRQLTVLNNLALSVFFVLLEGVSTAGAVTFNPVPVLHSSLGKLLSTGRFIELALLLQLLLLHEDVRGPTSPRPEKTQNF